MIIGDSRIKGGPGFLPLQAWRSTPPGDPWDIDKRPALIGMRMTGRLDKDDQLGHWVYDEATVGDVIGGQWWEQETDGRPIPMWRFATPVVLNTEGNPVLTGPMAESIEPSVGVNPSSGPSTYSGTGTVLEDQFMVPLWKEEYDPDDRFKTVEIEAPDPEKWPKFPKGWLGISLVADDETEQINYFLPTDSRLPAVHGGKWLNNAWGLGGKHGDAAMGALVCDMGPDFFPDPTRYARLQTLVKVVKDPKVDWGWGLVSLPAIPGTPPGGIAPNTLALNINENGLFDSMGGFVWDMDPSGNFSTTGPFGVSYLGFSKVLAHWSTIHSGIVDAGGNGCQHQYGIDGDGEKIFPTHISTDAYFKRTASTEDGPLDFTTYLPGDKNDKVMQVDCGFFPGEAHWFRAQYTTKPGKWKWWTTTPIYHVINHGEGTWGSDSDGGGANSTFTPDTDVRQPPEASPSPPVHNTVSGDVPLSKLRQLKMHDISEKTLPYTAVSEEFGTPAINFRSIHWSLGQVDFRYERKAGNLGMNQFDGKHPVALRADVWSKQVGNLFDYTVNPKKGRYLGGSANGGLIYLPPEVGMEMINNTTPLVPEAAKAPVSVSHVTVGPGARFAAGIPDLSGGGIERGYSWYEDGSGGLAFSTNVSSTITQRVKFDPDGNVGVGGESFGGGKEGVIFIRNVGRVPAANPTGGGLLYVSGGALMYRGSSGTITTIASA